MELVHVAPHPGDPEAAPPPPQPDDDDDDRVFVAQSLYEDTSLADSAGGWGPPSLAQ